VDRHSGRKKHPNRKSLGNLIPEKAAPALVFSSWAQSLHEILDEKAVLALDETSVHVSAVLLSQSSWEDPSCYQSFWSSFALAAAVSKEMVTATCVSGLDHEPIYEHQFCFHQEKRRWTKVCCWRFFWLSGRPLDFPSLDHLHRLPWYNFASSDCL
jgi:hypothetical protein